MVTQKTVKEYFIKLTCDTSSKEELAEQIWKDMNSNKREPYFKELEEYLMKGKKEKDQDFQVH